MPNFTQEYRSTDVGMPVLTGVAGSLTALLDAVLVNGGTAQAVTSITEAGTTYTAVIPADISLENKDWLVIAGAAPAGANGTVQITFIDSTHFSYQGPGGLGAITGAITYKRAPLGWTRMAGAAGVVAYQPAAVAGCPQFWLRIDDSDTLLTLGRAREACARAYETMSDANTGTGPFPTVAQAANGLCWRKSTTLDATVRPWNLVGDGATFYFVPNSDAAANTGRTLLAFGAFTSFRPADAYNALISGCLTFNSGTPSHTAGGIGVSIGMTSTTITNGSTGMFLARPTSQAGGSIRAATINRWIDTAGAASGTLGGVLCLCNYPSSTDGALWMDAPVFYETTTLPRGRPRGLYTHCHSANPFANDYDLAINVAGLPGVTLLSYIHASGNNTGSAQFDRYGPW